MHAPIDRESLRATIRLWSNLQLRLALERAIEHLTEVDLAALIAHGPTVDRHRSDAPAPTLLERVTNHASATRRGDFHGRYVIRNAHGQRQPWQTEAWIAATTHPFDVALAAARASDDTAAKTALRMLIDLVVDVDNHPEEWIEFEDDCAAFALSSDLDAARRLLGLVDPHQRTR